MPVSKAWMPFSGQRVVRYAQARVMEGMCGRTGR
jgi:hypothetical protein